MMSEVPGSQFMPAVFAWQLCLLPEFSLWTEVTNNLGRYSVSQYFPAKTTDGLCLSFGGASPSAPQQLSIVRPLAVEQSHCPETHFDPF